MTTGKYKNYSGKAGIGRTEKYWDGRRGQAALALAVSLWIAGAGIASATAESTTERGTIGLDAGVADTPITVMTTDDDKQNKNYTNEAAVTYAKTVTGAEQIEKSGKTLTIAGGDWSFFNKFAGGAPSGQVAAGDISGYTLSLSGVKAGFSSMKSGGVMCGASVSEEGNSNNNNLILDGVTAKEALWGIFGGYAMANVKTTGNAHYNTVTIKNSNLSGVVVGGYSDKYYSTACNNEVTVENSTIQAFGGEMGGICGGATGNETSTSAINNTVNLKNAIIGGPVWGGKHQDTDATSTDVVKGNTLNLAGANEIGDYDIMSYIQQAIKAGEMPAEMAGMTAEDIKAMIAASGFDKIMQGKVQNFQNINLTEATWGKPVLTFTGSNGILKNEDGTYPTISTEGIVFSGVNAIAAGDKTTLIQNGMPDEADFTAGGGAITGSTYKLGTTLQGEGKAAIVEKDLVFTADTGVSLGVQPQAHNTVMGAAASVAALFSGNDFITGAADGLALAANTGADGMATYANVGGSTMRQETGSHVNAHLWNAILAVGHKNEKTKADFEYGAFLEYGTGNYSTHNGDERGDGSTKYTGGGLLAKYSLKNGAYVEGSLRGGRIHDDATNLLRDEAHNPCSYTANANYWGFHLGVGRELALDDKHTLDLYGKYFYNHRGSVSFEVGGQYELDGVSSKILRLGGRYTMQAGENWKWYGGLAYEHEFGGEATGTADGLAIRSASTRGGSVRGELGATMQQAGSPWSIDVNLSGFAGKKQGLAGGVAVKYNF